MNSEASLKWPEEVNRALLTIKDALRQVAKVDTQIQDSRQLRAARPELAKQLELAEEFFLMTRKGLLDLEGPVSTLAGISDALVALLDRYETEQLTLKGRLLLIGHEGGAGDSIGIRDKEKRRLAQVEERCKKIRVTIQEIKETLSEYAIKCSRGYLNPRTGQKA